MKKKPVAIIRKKAKTPPADVELPNFQAVDEFSKTFASESRVKVEKRLNAPLKADGSLDWDTMHAKTKERAIQALRVSTLPDGSAKAPASSSASAAGRCLDMLSSLAIIGLGASGYPTDVLNVLRIDADVHASLDAPMGRLLDKYFPGVSDKFGDEVTVLSGLGVLGWMKYQQFKEAAALAAARPVEGSRVEEKPAGPKLSVGHIHSAKRSGPEAGTLAAEFGHTSASVMDAAEAQERLT